MSAGAGTSHHDAATAPARADAEMPRVWLVLSDKVGDNAQARILADATGLPYEIRNLVMRPRWVHGKPRFRPTLGHLDLSRSDRLEPPWPDLVITIGRRCAMAALWIKQQSGGRTRLVLIGRPKGRLARFDLVVAPPQYGVPDAPNVVRLRLPLMRADPARLETARAAWHGRLAGLPRPLTAVLVGGATLPFRFDATVAAAFAHDLLTLQANEGGSLWVTTSRRTGADAVQALARHLGGVAGFFQWSPDARDNPYFGLLAHADRFVVTGDSVSMMVEVARLGRPLAIYDLPLIGSPVERLKLACAGPLQPGRALGRVGDWLRAAGLLGVSRDLRAFHRRLYAMGLAVPFGAPFRPGAPAGDPDLAQAAAQVWRLTTESAAAPCNPG